MLEQGEKCFALEEFEVDSLSEYSESSRSEVHATPSLKCTGRGRRPKSVPSIFELNLPEVVVQNMKEQTRSKGRGRARFLNTSLSRTKPSFGLGHGKSAGDSVSKVSNIKIAATEKKFSYNKSPESAPAGTPIQVVLADANKRFASYGYLKHNPARKAPENDGKEPSIEEKLAQLSKNSERHVRQKSWNLTATSQNRDEEYPALPSLNSSQFQPGTHQQKKPVAVGFPLGSHSNIKSSVAEFTTHDSKENHGPNVGQSDTNLVNDNMKEEIDNLWEVMNSRKTEDQSPADFPLLDNQHSNTKKSRHESGSSRGSRKQSESRSSKEEEILELEGHYVRMEGLPSNITQSQLEDVITPYGQVLDLKLELRISDGEENFSADVKLADESIAEFLVSCFDGAETIFEGTHNPVRCFIK